MGVFLEALRPCFRLKQKENRHLGGPIPILKPNGYGETRFTVAFEAMFAPKREIELDLTNPPPKGRQPWAITKVDWLLSIRAKVTPFYGSALLTFPNGGLK